MYRLFWKMVIFQYNLYIFGIHLWTMLYPKPCYNEPCYKEVVVYVMSGYGYLEVFQKVSWHTCQISHWDKISQNLAHLEGNSHKKFKSHRIFRPFYNRFYEEININHTLLWFSQAFYMKKKNLRLNWGFKKISQNFVKSPLKFCLISQILFHSLWHVCFGLRDTRVDCSFCHSSEGSDSKRKEFGA